MNEFVVQKTDSPNADYVIFSTSVDSPLFNLGDIKNMLSLKNGEKILFDQLLQVGNSENRFLQLQFRNGDFDFGSARNIDNNSVDYKTKFIIFSFLRENPTVLKYSILLSDQKKAILNGRVL